MKIRHDLATLAIGLSVDGDGVERGPDGLPVAFRLFRAGPNETTKGTFIFDAVAAESVMSAAKAYGNDLAIDLEHASLDPDAPNWDPDARGYFNLELRNGELWAVNVRWSPDGERRLREKTQRYISPAFPRDAEGRVIELVNIALVAQPATFSTPALIAAHRGTPMTPYVQKVHSELTARLSIAQKKIAKLADAAPEGDAPAGKFASVQAAAEEAANMLAEVAKGGSDVDSSMQALDAARAAVKAFCDAADALGGEPAAEPAADPAADPAAASAAPAEDPQKMSRIERENAQLRAALATERHEKEVARLSAEATRRSGVTQKLTGRQITITPAVMTVLSKHLPVDALEQLDAAAGSVPVALGGPSAQVPGGADGSKTFTTPFGVVTLTANQLRECERAGAKPEVLAESLARRTGAKR